MNRLASKIAAAVLLPASMLILTSCANNGDGKAKGDETVTEVATPSGAAVVETIKLNATVTAVDAATRHVTLELPDGTSKTIRAGQHVILSTVKAGENVTVQYAESVAITVEAP